MKVPYFGDADDFIMKWKLEFKRLPSNQMKWVFWDFVCLIDSSTPGGLK